jgi:hypothetical protein
MAASTEEDTRVAEARTLFEKYDKDGNNGLDKTEFASIMVLFPTETLILISARHNVTTVATPDAAL